MALSLAQHFDPYFGAKRIAFTAKEFLDLLPKMPNKGWIVWDEVGVYLSHRRWQSEANIMIMQVLQSFRYKLINVIFTLPSAVYMDVVARTMCHYLLVMNQRGVATVYRILKPTYAGSPWTKRRGAVFSEMPTAFLWDDFERRRTEHQDALYEQSRQLSEARVEKEKDKLEKTLTPKITGDELLRIAKVALPQIVNVTKDSDHGLIRVPKLREILKESTGKYININRAYSLRDGLLDHIHADGDAVLKKLRKEK